MKLIWLKPIRKWFIHAAAIVFGCIQLSAQFAGQPEPAPGSRAIIPSGGLQFSPEDQFHGSVAAGQATETPLPLSLKDAIDRGIKNNLGLLVRGSQSSAARAERALVLSSLLPSISGGISRTETQINLAIYGFHFSGIPTVVGPFSYTDARANAMTSLFNWTSIKNLKSAAESARASQLSVEDGRDLVVQAVASGYFAILADTGSVNASRVQVDTAQELYTVAKDRHQAGVSAAIDELRAQVELKTQQQRLVADRNQLAKDKLALGRAIGLPSGQDFNLTDEAPYVPLEGLKAENLLDRAYQSRADYRSAQAQVHASEIALQAARAERYPSAFLTGNYGDIGSSLANSHGTFSVTGSVNFNIFDGGRIRADELTASSELDRRRNEMADLRGKIEFEVRSALLDLSTAADEVALAQSNLDLANQTLAQARDRFASGVADNIEVIQAQEALAGANQDLVNSLYAHNLAKASLARAVGGTEASLRQFLGGK